MNYIIWTVILSVIVTDKILMFSYKVLFGSPRKVGIDRCWRLLKNPS